MRYKVSGAIVIPKASWGCAPALPNRIQMVSLRITIPNQKPQANKKFFDPAIFQKCWRGSGRVAHICETNEILQSGFPAAIAFFLKLPNSELTALRETNRIRFGRIASLSACVLFAGVALSELPMNVS